MAIETFIDLFSDFGYKRIFGHPKGKVLLIHFLNNVLQGKRHVQDVELLPTEKKGRSKLERDAIFDISCRDEEGNMFIVELQKVPQEHFFGRMLYYAAHLLVEQAPKGGKEWDYKQPAVYVVGILNFILDQRTTNYINTYQLRADGYDDVVYDNFAIITLEMPKFQKEEKELETDLDKWMYYYKHMKSFPSVPGSAGEEEIWQVLFDLSKTANLTKEEMRMYTAEQKVKWDNYATKKYALKKAREEGMEKGMEKGIEEGKIKVAQNMKAAGMPLEAISQLTGLNLEKLKDI